VGALTKKHIAKSGRVSWGEEERVLRPGLEWLRTDRLRGLVGYEPSVEVPEGLRYDPDAYARAYERMGMRSAIIVAKHHQGIMAYPSAFNPLKPKRDYFGEQVEALKHVGLRAFAYYSVGPDNWAGSNHPEWLVTTRDGRRFSTPYWTFLWLCLNTDYATYALNQIREIVENYPVDGVWLDILRYPMPAGGVQDDVCFCAGCTAAWSGDRNLLDVAGTEELLRFHAEVHTKFLQQVRRIVDAQNRPVAVTFNGAGKWLAPGYEECDALADFGSMECHNPIRRTTWGRFYRSLGEPFELLSCAQLRWGHTIHKPDTLLQLELASTAVHGGVCVFGVHMYADGYLSPGKVHQLEKLRRWCEEREDLLVDSDPVCDVAIAAYRAPLGVSSSADGFSSRSGYELFPEWARVLRQGHFLFAILPDACSLKGLRMVILPAGRAVSADECEALRSFVGDGGCLIAESPVARMGGDGRFLLEDLLGVSHIGSCTASFHYFDATEPALQRDLMEDQPLLLRNPVTLVTVNGAHPIATLTHQFLKGKPSEGSRGPYEPTREVAHAVGASVHSVGRGKVVFLAAPFVAPEPYDPPSTWASGVSPYPPETFGAPSGEPTPLAPHEHISPWARAFLENLITWLLDPPTVSIDAPPEIELVLNKQSNRYILHFLNHAYGPSQFIDPRGETRRLGPMRVRIDQRRLNLVSRVRLVPENRTLEAAIRNGLLEFDLPYLGIHQAVELA
jgi:Hypothetical glycosyl hydrolase 6